MLIVITKSNGIEWIMERKLSDANDWDATVRSIAAGEWTDISMVYSTGEGFDALPSMAKQVADIWAERDEPLADWQKDFLQDNGVTGKRRALQAAE